MKVLFHFPHQRPKPPTLISYLYHNLCLQRFCRPMWICIVKLVATDTSGTETIILNKLWLNDYYSDYFAIWSVYYPSWHLPVQSQQCKHQKNLWNISKVYNENTRTTPLTLFYFLYNQIETDFKHYSGLFLADFEQVNVKLDISNALLICWFWVSFFIAKCVLTECWRMKAFI